MESIDVVVIGGGVVGLAVAAQLAGDGREVCLLERHARLGAETSTRNSGVIHAGIYYPPGSLKAKLSVEGRELLYEFAERHGVPHERCGKLIVAASIQETATIDALIERGRANGVKSLTRVGIDFIKEREPNIRAVAGVWSPDTGIIDADALIRALRDLCIVRGVHILLASAVLGGEARNDGHIIKTERESILASTVVNAAGLWVDEVSSTLGGEQFRTYPCRGEYAEIVPSKRHLIRGLVYPVPEPTGHGLGVHFTRTPDGTVCLGPTVKYQDRKDDYETDRIPLIKFHAAAQRLLPELRIDDLRMGAAGIRPKLHGPEGSFADFVIRRDQNHPHLLHLAGIESPGLTASLAIARYVAVMLNAPTRRALAH